LKNNQQESGVFLRWSLRTL